nr:hypothetical protein [Porticoccaceae bacterium]
MTIVKRLRISPAFALAALQISIAGIGLTCSDRQQIEPESMNRLRTLTRVVARLAILWTLIAVIGCTADQQIQTLRPGVLTVAVTSGAPTNQYD